MDHSLYKRNVDDIDATGGQHAAWTATDVCLDILTPTEVRSVYEKKQYQNQPCSFGL